MPEIYPNLMLSTFYSSNIKKKWFPQTYEAAVVNIEKKKILTTI